MKPDKIAYLLVLLVMLGWGISVFFDKLATNRLGNRSIIPIIFSCGIGLIPLIIFLFYSKNLNYDAKGIMWLIVASVLNAIGVISYFLVFVRSEVTWATPMTALYPVIPIILAFIFLKETVTITKIIGILLSFGAIIFLSL
ncbi:MAG TPA: DMT family transporter [Patescibacteria group bacterium]|nr:DMT family transporter [Patescibacteria group bacterium]